ncbi:MAG: histidine phosphatase family protein [Phormidesmis priestleyi]|uniref:Histidine phosphatase family protein n=1 Tax=Phormidesmis priestleyi TaxID=268141 RepID=A0A2W4XH62_9CYAN|nr:MAG: histidine phosphatase family protein [Phormidesmis priestleyi]
MIEVAYLKILLVRHAQSFGNQRGEMEGQTSTALCRQGQQQAQRLSHRLLTIGHQPSHLYSSPLLRAKQTADAIATALSQAGHPISYYCADNALQEMHQGIFQGLTWAQAQAQYPKLCAQLMTDLAWQPVPQAETLSAARARAHAWVNHVLQVHSLGEVVWAVAHEGILQQLVAVLMGCDRTWKIPIAHTAIFEFWLAAKSPRALTHDRFNPEYWHIHRFNDCAHLLP